MANCTPTLANVTTPNPLTPMAFLPADLAYQVTISAYILSGTTGVMIWDFLNHLNCDYELVSKFPSKITTWVYIISRLASMGYALAATVFTTAPTGNCYSFDKVLGWLFSIAFPFSALLFLFRIRAVFYQNMYVIAFFVFTWVAVVAGCLTTTQGGKGMEIGPTQYCLSAALASYTSAAVIIPVVNDSLVFLAISWRLAKNGYSMGQVNLKRQVRTMVLGDYMPAFSRGLLKDGQAYYLTTVSVGLLTLVMLYVPGVPPVYRTMFTVPNIALMNIMACRVFRNTRFGKIGGSEVLSTLKASGTANTANSIELSVSHSDVRFCHPGSSEVDRSNNRKATSTLDWKGEAV